MSIFYCILLVVILFLTFMEIITWPANVDAMLGDRSYSHVAHILVYVIMFICICFLLRYELYM